MNPKSAALLAMVGTALWAAFIASDVVRLTLSSASGAVAPIMLLRSFVMLFVTIALTLFFWSFYNSQR
jgi:hypothetical protein